MSKKKFTKTYGEEAQWQGLVPEDIRKTDLELVGNKRHEVVNEIRGADAYTTDGMMTGADEYSAARDLYNDLPDVTPAVYPDVYTFMALDNEAKARTMQRLLTDLSKRMEYVELPPPPPQGGGGGGGGGGTPPRGGQPPKQPGKGQGQPQQGQGQQPQPGQGQGQQPQGGGGGQPSPPQPQYGTNEVKRNQQGRPAAAKDQRMTGVENTPPESSNISGGGMQYRSLAKNAGLFWAIRDLINKLAVDTDWLDTIPEGADKWDTGRVFRSGFNANYLRNAKDDYRVTVDEMYLSLDTSGSVRMYADEIAAMAAGAVGTVRLFHGTEGKPQIEIMRKNALKFPGQAFPEWDEGRNARLVRNPELAATEVTGDARHAGGSHYSQYSAEFNAFIAAWMKEQEANFPTLPSYWNHEYFEPYLAWLLYRYRPTPGTRLLFWGDTHGVYFANPYLLKQMVRNYRFVWMTPFSPREVEGWTKEMGGKEQLEEYFQHDKWWKVDRAEFLKLEYVGLPVLHNVNSAASVRQSLRRIQTL